jgi:holo-[acyl-carrier protein] synthase
MASIGTDIEQISRIEAAMVRTPKFTVRLFTAAECAYCNGKANPAQHFAARFCGKEAYAKAIGHSLSWQDVEIVNNPAGAPVINVYNEAARVLNGRKVSISLSHAGDYAMATVLIED